MSNLRASLLVVAAGGLFAQPSPAPLTFEVATVKPAAPDQRNSGFRFLPGGGLQIQNVHLKGIISFAYDLRDFQISGGPGWLATVPFDILAKPEGAQAPADLAHVPDKQREVIAQQIRERLRSLLAERFQLVLHKETKEFPVYGLVVAKNGPKMEESKDGDGSPQNMNRNNSNGKNVLTAKRASIPMLVNALSNTLGRPVVDQTGLKGTYDLNMEWAQDLGGAGKGPDFPGEKPEAVSEASGPSIFTAIQQQLGLKLESQKGPVEVIVIDRAEKPSDN